VTGTIPEHLDGRYQRNGPNPVLSQAAILADLLRDAAHA
jgi:carotenoid cleavage dioxygenase-like enzyme